MMKIMWVIYQNDCRCSFRYPVPLSLEKPKSETVPFLLAALLRTGFMQAFQWPKPCQYCMFFCWFTNSAGLHRHTTDQEGGFMATFLSMKIKSRIAKFCEDLPRLQIDVTSDFRIGHPKRTRPFSFCSSPGVAPPTRSKGKNVLFRIAITCKTQSGSTKLRWRCIKKCQVWTSVPTPRPDPKRPLKKNQKSVWRIQNVLNPQYRKICKWWQYGAWFSHTWTSYGPQIVLCAPSPCRPPPPWAAPALGRSGALGTSGAEGTEDMASAPGTTGGRSPNSNNMLVSKILKTLQNLNPKDASWFQNKNEPRKLLLFDHGTKNKKKKHSTISSRCPRATSTDSAVPGRRGK